MKRVDVVTRMLRVFVVALSGWPLSETSSFVNVALNKPSSQIDSRNGENAYKANDGNKNANFGAGSCTCTDSTSNTWWMVDLLRNYDVQAVRIQNRVDSSAWRLRDFYVYTSTSNPLPMPTVFGDPVKGELCFYHQAALAPANPQPLYCNDHAQPIKARYVYIWKEQYDVLTLCEFEVLVPAVENGLVRSTSSLIYRGQKTNTTTPMLFSKVLQRNLSVSRCLAICVSETGHAVSHFQVNTLSGVCDCFQSASSTPAGLTLISDDDFDVYRVTDWTRGP